MEGCFNRGNGMGKERKEKKKRRGETERQAEKQREKEKERGGRQGPSFKGEHSGCAQMVLLVAVLQGPVTNHLNLSRNSNHTNVPFLNRHPYKGAVRTQHNTQSTWRLHHRLPMRQWNRFPNDWHSLLLLTNASAVQWWTELEQMAL